jgi:hypothetical protein
MKAWGALVLVTTMSAVVEADDIYLVGGGKISGEVVERTAGRIVVETGPGRLTLPMSRVTRVEAGRSALYEFQERARTVKAGDVGGWLALGRWADQSSLGTQAREAYQRAVALDPANAEANAALGRVQADGRWMSQEDAYRAQGLVPFDGSWVSPAEREAARRDRSEADLSDRAAREVDARVREAEARARAAEAEAERAEAQPSSQEPYAEGIPYLPYGGTGGVYRPHRDHPRGHPRPTPPTTPVPRPRPTSLNGSAAETPATPAPMAPVKKR